MPTSYIIDQNSLTLHLFVHIPLLRDQELMKMFQYKSSQIPISTNFGISITGHQDILAYSSKYFVTLSSRDLWKCKKLATVHFCKDIVNYLRPISEMSNTCLGSLKEEHSGY